MNRRESIKKILSYAAVAFLPMGLLCARPVVIEGKTFNLSSPFIVDRDYTVLRDCRFIADDGYYGDLLEICADHVTVHGCTFVGY